MLFTFEAVPVLYKLKVVILASPTGAVVDETNDFHPGDKFEADASRIKLFIATILIRLSAKIIGCEIKMDITME